MNDLGYFKSGANLLSFSATYTKTSGKGTGIVFVHAADGNKLGPHRMFVELARRFTDKGYPTFRFDLAGCGDSTGSVSTNGLDGEIADTANAIEFFTVHSSIDDIVLLGISRGALVCYRAMLERNLPLQGLILLSMPYSSHSTGLRSFAGELKQYFYKIKQPEYRHKLIHRQANLRQIGSTLKKALTLKNRYKETIYKDSLSKPPILFIYAGNDTTAQKSSEYYTKRCTQKGLRCDCYFIPGANHSFFHYAWKKQIFEVSLYWLQKITVGKTL